MGRLIEELAPSNGFDVALRLRSGSNLHGSGITKEAFEGIDVAIEFSTPAAVTSNLLALAALRIPTVTGTTGWLASLPEVTQAFEASGTGLVSSPNFSVGVAVFQKLVELAADLMASRAQYGSWAWEIHHAAKKDAPSGTLLHLVEAMRSHGYLRPIDVSSNRVGHHPGTHEIGFDSTADTITLRHAARGREGFAQGALQSANWIIGKTGFHTFEEVLFTSPQPNQPTP